jgi:hypothetical protein
VDSATFGLLLLKDVNEHNHEQKVDEVHRLDQTNGQEEVLTRFVLDLGLTRNGGNGLATGQAVTNRCPDCAATEGETAADKGTRNAHCAGDVIGINCCHFPIPPGFS